MHFQHFRAKIENRTQTSLNLGFPKNIRRRVHVKLPATGSYCDRIGLGTHHVGIMEVLCHKTTLAGAFFY